jgi:hypothetical protein
MTQNASDVEIANQGFAAFRQDLNDVLEDITTLHSGDSAPSTTYANQLWYETDTDTLYIRNEDNDAWIDLAVLDQTNDDATLIGDIKRKAASGTDIAGTDLTIQGGAGTGTGAGGKIIFQTADGGSTGSTVNSYATAMTITDDAKVGIGTGSPSSYDSRGNNLVVGDTGDAGVTIFSGSTSDGRLVFASSGDTGLDNGVIAYDQNGDTMAFETGGSERMRIDSSGNVGIGMTTSGDSRHEVYGTDAATVYKNTTSGSGTGDGLYVGLGKGNSTIGYLYNRENNHIIIGTNNTERVRIEGSTGYFKAQGVYDGTTGGGSAVRVLSNGYVFRFTSSQRYKNTIIDATHGLTELLTLRPVTYKHNSDGDTIYGGLIAEEVHTAGLTEFIEYDEDGDPDALRYDSMVSLCIKAIQELKAELDAEKTKVATLQTQATDFETRIAALESA